MGVMGQPAGTQQDMAHLFPAENDLDQDGIDATAAHVAEILKDLRLAECVEQALRKTGHLPLRAIQISACARLVILQGLVPSYYLKQVAQTAALGVPGVEAICNDLEIG
jgi:osmotically-inducible protein OsmY